MRVRVNVGAERGHETVDEGCEAVADSSAAANYPERRLRHLRGRKRFSSRR